MHRTPSSLRERLDTNNLRTSETNIMNQSMKTLGQYTSIYYILKAQYGDLK
jgi:hypothetical protein